VNLHDKYMTCMILKPILVINLLKKNILGKKITRIYCYCVAGVILPFFEYLFDIVTFVIIFFSILKIPFSADRAAYKKGIFSNV
jgi:hypothetical protein